MKVFELCFWLVILGAFSGRAQSEKTWRDFLPEPSNKESPYNIYISAFAGPAYYLGDIGGKPGAGKPLWFDARFYSGNWARGIDVTYLRNKVWGLRFSYSRSFLSASDQDISFQGFTDPAYQRYRRNLNFRTEIREGSLLFEWYPLRWLPSGYTWHQLRLHPYGILGIGRFTFNPQGSYFDDIAQEYSWVNLQPLGTEGQGMLNHPDRNYYALQQWNLPHGFGLGWRWGSGHQIAWEIIGRKLFTDYLDDVSKDYPDPNGYSTILPAEDALLAAMMSNKSSWFYRKEPGEPRGNPSKNDYYFSWQIRVSLCIRGAKTSGGRSERAGRNGKTPYKHFKYDNTEICDQP